MADQQDPSEDRELAHGAARGDTRMRQAVSDLVHPMVMRQTGIFCKRYCQSHHFHFACTLFPEWGRKPSEVPLCNWGNGSYGWMLDELTKPDRLLRFEARDGATLSNYLVSIICSQSFYERWKDWRFGRRVRVPTYIQELGQHASRMFLELHNGDAVASIAQRLGMVLADAETLAKDIIAELTRRHRLYLLDPPKVVSLTGLGGGNEDDGDGVLEADIPDHSQDPQRLHDFGMLAAGWQALSPIEQFVLENMVVDELDANAVLQALCESGISIVEGVPPDQTNRQQLYYFRRKAVAKLAKQAELIDDDSKNGDQGFN